jgi:hypothetical protein
MAAERTFQTFARIGPPDGSVQQLTFEYGRKLWNAAVDSNICHYTSSNCCGRLALQIFTPVLAFRNELNAKYPSNRNTTAKIAALIGRSMKICSPLSEISKERRKFDSVIGPKMAPIITGAKG